MRTKEDRTSVPFREKMRVLFFLITLLATKTRFFTTIILAAAATLYYSKVSPAIKFLFVATAIAATCFIVFESNFISNLYDRGESKDETLSGRTTIWVKSIGMINAKLWAGYGFSTFYSDLTSWFFSDYIAPHAHNTWINAAFETGIIGAGLMTIALLTGITAYIRIYLRDKVLPTGALIWVVVILGGAMGVIYGGKINPFVGITLLLLMQELMKEATGHVKQRGSSLFRHISFSLPASSRH